MSASVSFVVGELRKQRAALSDYIVLNLEHVAQNFYRRVVLDGIDGHLLVLRRVVAPKGSVLQDRAESR